MAIIRRGLQGAFTFTQAATPVRVPADGVLDGVKHWDSSVRPHIQKMPGKFTGSYWFSTPMMAVPRLQVKLFVLLSGRPPNSGVLISNRHALGWLMGRLTTNQFPGRFSQLRHSICWVRFRQQMRTHCRAVLSGQDSRRSSRQWGHGALAYHGLPKPSEGGSAQEHTGTIN